MMDGSVPPSSSGPIHHHPYPPPPHQHQLPQPHPLPHPQQQHHHHHFQHNHQHHHPPSSSSSSSSTIPTTLSSASSSSPSSAAVFRPRRSDDWQQYRPIIEQLYLNNQLKLRDVKNIMERDHHFVASYVVPQLRRSARFSFLSFLSFFFFFLFREGPVLCTAKTNFNSANSIGQNHSEKQYKDRLAAWHIRKNIKAKEVHVMIRKQQKRAARGKQTAFRVGGQAVDSKRISRFVRRYGSSWENNASSPGATGAVGAAGGRFSGDPKSPPISYTPEPGMLSFLSLSSFCAWSYGSASGIKLIHDPVDTPTDMSCYTPEPEDRRTPLSPMPEIPADPRELQTIRFFVSKRLSTERYRSPRSFLIRPSATRRPRRRPILLGHTESQPHDDQ